MIYRAIGTMSGSSMDGLDIAYCTFEEIGGKWNVEITNSDCVSFNDEWLNTLDNLQNLTAKELLISHCAFGKWMGESILHFIEKNNLEHKVHLIASHGHTVFHEPQLGMTFQMGDGASIAAITKLPVVTDLRNMDIALGGQGAPIVPIAEKLLWNDYQYFLNIGGICNVTASQNEQHIAFDVCPANRVLNLLIGELGKTFDKDGETASAGNLNEDLLNELNGLEYYQKPFPKSLSNEFGTNEVFNLLKDYNISIEDKLHTYCHHIAVQIKNAVQVFSQNKVSKMMITGGGAFNSFLIECIEKQLQKIQIEIHLPDEQLINNKEAVAMALIGILRWREENNVLSSVTGALRNSVGGALWMGQD